MLKLKEFGVPANMKLIANIIGGAIIGLITSVLAQVALSIIGYPIAKTGDQFNLMLYGGAVSAVIVSIIIMWLKDRDEVIKMNLWVGLVLIFSILFAGAIAPIVVLSPAFILIDLIGIKDPFNYFIEDVIGSFNMGGLAIGIILGLANYYEPVIDRT